jgi:hypothetical protein
LQADKFAIEEKLKELQNEVATVESMLARLKSLISSGYVLLSCQSVEPNRSCI